MAKRSHLDWTRDHIAEISTFSVPPGKPMLAYLYRRYKTLQDALRFWRIDCPRTDKTTLAEARARYLSARARTREFFEFDPLSRLDILPVLKRSTPSEEPPVGPLQPAAGRILEAFSAALGEIDAATTSFVSHLYAGAAPLRKKAADQILGALGDSLDYGRARTEVIAVAAELSRAAQGRRFDDDPAAWLENEIVTEILPLINLYENPRQFFIEMAPRIWAHDFLPLGADCSGGQLLPGPVGESLNIPAEMSTLGVPMAVALTRCLWRWGFGALHNPHVRQALDELDEETRSEMFSILDGKIRFSEGRPVGTGLSSQQAQEVYQDALAHVAETMPQERAEDRSIYGEDAAPREAPRRNPSKESAARELAKEDLATSRRTLRRKLKDPDRTSGR